MPSISDSLANQLTEHQVELLRVAAKKSRDVLALLERVEADLVKRIRGRALSSASKARVQEILASTRKEIANVYGDIRDSFNDKMRALIKAEAQVTATIVNSTFGVDIYDGTLPRNVLNTLVSDTLVQGAPSEEWWSRQAGDLEFRFSNELRTGIAQGETNAQLIERISGSDGVLEVPRRNAAALVQTSVQTFANEARMASFQENSDIVKGTQQVSTLDDKTTDICIAYDGASWDMDGNPINGTKLPFNGGPPRHWNCRSVLIPLTKSWKELGAKLQTEIPASTRASMDGQVASQTTFADWLDTKSIDAQNQILGEGKAQLWRDGKMSLQQLLDQRGNPLSLDELLAKYDKGSA